MALGNEVVAKNDPEEESKSVEDQIAEILGQGDESSEKQQVDNEETPVEDTPTETPVEDTPAETPVDDTPTETEPEPQEEDINQSAKEADHKAEPQEEEVEAEPEEEEEEVDLIPPAEEEEEEEVDLIDPVDEIRVDCEAQQASQKYFEKLEECNNRVTSRSNTAEMCHEEMMDWVHSVDHCVSHSLFNKIK